MQRSRLHASLESYKLKRSIVPQFPYSDFLNPKHRYHHSRKSEENLHIGHAICMWSTSRPNRKKRKKKYHLNSRGPLASVG